ncbi:hypothetical protein J437_LFUL000556, partial [Ladona fulva]
MESVHVFPTHCLSVIQRPCIFSRLTVAFRKLCLAVVHFFLPPRIQAAPTTFSPCYEPLPNPRTGDSSPPSPPLNNSGGGILQSSQEAGEQQLANSQESESEEELSGVLGYYGEEFKMLLRRQELEMEALRRKHQEEIELFQSGRMRMTCLPVYQQDLPQRTLSTFTVHNQHMSPSPVFVCPSLPRNTEGRE